jgi:hypothetical protein
VIDIENNLNNLFLKFESLGEESLLKVCPEIKKLD